MNIRLITLLVAALCSFSIQAQVFEYELGEVTKEQLEQKEHPIEKDAPAAILFNKGETYLTFSEGQGFKMITEIAVKIKIYNKDGYNWANKTIRYFDDGGSRQTVDISKSYTYNLEDGRIKKSKLKKEGKFTEEINKFWKAKKIVMPEVKEGSIIEYRYKIISPFLNVFPEWYFQDGIPVDHSRYITRIPEYFTYTPNFRGYYTPKTTKKQVNKTIVFGGKRSNGNQGSNQEYIESITTYEFKDLPAIKDESFINTIANYITSVEHELTSVRYPNEPIKSLSSTWNDVAKSIYDNDNFGNELRKTSYFEDDINALLSGLTSQKERMDAIYTYVRDRMNWNEYHSYSCDDGVRKAYKSEVGNIAEINLMLTSMLRYAGLEANPVLVTTRSQKVALYPSRTAFNYVIAAVQMGGKTILLDATSKSCIPNILPFRALNWSGRLIKKDGTSLGIDMIPKEHSIESTSIMAELDEEGTLTGKLKAQQFDYNAYAFRERYGSLSTDSRISRLEKSYEGITIEDSYSVTKKDFSKPVIEEYEFTHNGVVDIIGDKIYISPMLFLMQEENPFKQEKREYPIDFIYPRQDRYMISIKLPEGYVVESVPESISLGMEQGIGDFNYNVVANSNQIMLRATMNINYAAISQEYYTTIKDFFQQTIEKQTEKIVLVKK
ncbi:MAG: transglutaminase [Flavobacterium sp. MedPE-SWcel]|uniref:DUF3857 domain-containing protein n=1 Tax=uncultured Flavobacterium sp. TaxID=165435 RepID=UPI00091A4BBB|nr:DUF3857 domain-containing protein [uncultured Flavobacterium sp.]OIQ21305.1 MAG: transglutaminase [Flavobacterium sp. MedPE-SWcel]